MSKRVGKKKGKKKAADRVKHKLSVKPTRAAAERGSAMSATAIESAVSTSHTEESKFEDCKEETQRWVAGGAGIALFVDWALADGGVGDCGGNFALEFDKMATKYVQLHADGCHYDNKGGDVVFYREQWCKWRASKSRLQAFSHHKFILLDRDNAWARVETAMHKPREQFAETQQVIDAEMEAMEIPTVFFHFPLQLTATQEFAIRYIVSKDKNMRAMVARLPKGQVLTAKEFFTAMGAKQLVELFSEFGADNGLNPSGEVQQFVERHFHNQCHAIRAFNDMDEGSRVLAVESVRKAWRRGQVVTELEYLVALKQCPELCYELVAFIEDGTLSSEAALRQLYTSGNPIVDLRVVKGVQPHFQRKNDAKVAALEQIILKKLKLQEEREAFDALLKVKSKTFAKGPLHGVAVFKGTDEFALVAPKPHSSTEAVRKSAVQMHSDKRLPALRTLDAAHCASKAMECREVDREFRDILTRLKPAGAQVLVATVKDARRVQTKSYAEYEGDEFPKSEYLTDKVRGSLLFDSFPQLLAGINAVIKGIAEFESDDVKLRLLRIKNTLLYLFKKGFGDVKINVLITVRRADGSVATAIAEIQCHYRVVFEANHRVHADYDVTRLLPFFEEVAASELTPATISCRKQLEECMGYVTLPAFFDHFGADYRKTVRRMLRISDLTLENADAILAVTGDWNPFKDNGNAVAAFVYAHGSDLQRWVEFLNKVYGSELWKLLQSYDGKIAATKHISCGYWQPAVIAQMLPSGDVPLKARQLADNKHMTPLHFAARLAPVVGGVVFEELTSCFGRKCAERMKKTVSKLTGTALCEYLNHGGEDLAVARTLIPLPPAQKWFDAVKDFVDFTPKRVQMVTELVAAEYLHAFEGKRFGMLPWHRYAMRCRNVEEINSEVLAFLKTGAPKSVKPQAMAKKLWEIVKIA